MRVSDGLGDRLEDRQESRQPVGRALAAIEQFGECVPLDQLHGEERPSVAEETQFIDRNDAGMLQLAADLRLLDEPADHIDVVAEVFAKNFHRDVAAEVGVTSPEDLAHAPACDLAVDAVAHSGIAAAVLVGSNERWLEAVVGVTQEYAGDNSRGSGECVEHAGRCRPSIDGRRPLFVLRDAAGMARESRTQMTTRTKVARGSRTQGRATFRACRGFGHCKIPQSDTERDCRLSPL